jgi:hypothetical protein
MPETSNQATFLKAVLSLTLKTGLTSQGFQTTLFIGKKELY